MSVPLNDQELEILKNNPDIARHVISQVLKANEHAKNTYEGTDPVEEASFYLKKSLMKKLDYYKRNLSQLINIQAKETRPDYQHNPTLMKNLFEKAKASRAERIENLKLQIAGVENKISDFNNKKEGIFLPVGSIVEFSGKENYPRCFDPANLPEAGTKGIVTGLNKTGEFPVRIAIIENYINSLGEHIHIDDNMKNEGDTFFVDADTVKVISLPTVLNPLTNEETEIETYTYEPTHYVIGSTEECMVLKSGDYFLSFIMNKNEYGRDDGLYLIAVDDESILTTWLGDVINQAPKMNF